MELDLIRYSSSKESTLGLLLVNDQFICYTLEDQYQPPYLKVHGETRIPAGVYDLALRKEGGFHQRYSSRFADLPHKGMLWVRDVPGFEWILIHVGNNDDDTAGCILVGDGCQQNVTERGALQGSVSAYRRLYPMVAGVLEVGLRVTLRVRGLDL